MVRIIAPSRGRKSVFVCSTNWDLSVLQGSILLEQEAAFARRKRRKAAGGKPTWAFPRTPSCPFELVERLLCGAALVAQGCSEFPLSAEATLRKIAALFLCRLSGSRTGLKERMVMPEVKKNVHSPVNSGLSLSFYHCNAQNRKPIKACGSDMCMMKSGGKRLPFQRPPGGNPLVGYSSSSPSASTHAS